MSRLSSLRISSGEKPSNLHYGMPAGSLGQNKRPVSGSPICSGTLGFKRIAVGQAEARLGRELAVTPEVKKQIAEFSRGSLLHGMAQAPLEPVSHLLGALF